MTADYWKIFETGDLKNLVCSIMFNFQLLIQLESYNVLFFPMICGKLAFDCWKLLKIIVKVKSSLIEFYNKATHEPCMNGDGVLK